MKQETELVITLSRLNNKIIKHIDGHLSVHGISFTEYLVLLHLAGSVNKQSRRIDVADNVGLSASGVTRLLAPMEKIGLVSKEKAERDARVSLVKLTRAGGKIYTDAEKTVNLAATQMLEGVTSVQRKTLIDLLQKLN